MQNLRFKLGPLFLLFGRFASLAGPFEIQVQAHLVQLLFLNYQMFLMTKPQTSWEPSEDLAFNLFHLQA